ncbi:hypothetical protein FGIG_11267 [Fasciola gigantica]|uniref:Uncharacterized protein n=1 Tax=Fasciola gigantica TaxID=46835 RepID=A0A504Y478_FASGI|nr:hypothetical protein FGIG_11267 [Fasciola gigantica]
MEQSNGYQNVFSAIVTTGNTPTANLIPTENEDPATSDGNAEATERSLIEYCVQLERDLPDVSRRIRILWPILPQSPMDARTWFGTTKTINILHVSPGEYFHRGLETALMKLTQNLRLANAQEFTIQLHVEGMHRLAPSNTRIWTTLCRLVRPMNSTPFLIGVYSETRQPENMNDYFQPAVDWLMPKIECDSNWLPWLALIPLGPSSNERKTHPGYGSCDECTNR